LSIQSLSQAKGRPALPISAGNALLTLSADHLIGQSAQGHRKRIPSGRKSHLTPSVSSGGIVIILLIVLILLFGFGGYRLGPGIGYYGGGGLSLILLIILVLLLLKVI
jgi:hypothetical protein